MPTYGVNTFILLENEFHDSRDEEREKGREERVQGSELPHAGEAHLPHAGKAHLTSNISDLLLPHAGETLLSNHPLQYPIHPSEDRLHPSLITNPQTPKTHLSDRQPRPTPPASRSRHHHPRPTTLILRSPAMHRQVQVELSSRSRPTQDRSSPFALTNLSFP